MQNSINLFNYKIYCGKTENIFEGIKKQGVINTINPHSYLVSKKDVAFQSALQHSEILLPDGIGIVYAAKIVLNKKIERIAGFDLFVYLLKELNSKKSSCFFLGSGKNTLELIKKRLNIEYPDIRAGFFSPPYKEAFDEADNKMMIEVVNEFEPEVLFVGMTAPKQEKWVYQNKERLNAKIIASIGAVFDFYAGTVKRSPKIFISLGLEWLPRLIKEPKRLWRRNFISTPVFLYCVFKEKIKNDFLNKRSYKN